LAIEVGISEAISTTYCRKRQNSLSERYGALAAKQVRDASAAPLVTENRLLVPHQVVPPKSGIPDVTHVPTAVDFDVKTIHVNLG
jgi:hypothetical protein